MFLTKFIIRYNLFSHLVDAFKLGEVARYILVATLILVCIAVPYMLGGVNFGIVISKLKYHDDIRNYGSGNAGATNMLRVWGKGAAALTLGFDMFKCVIAVIIGALLLGDVGANVAGLFCVMGHVFPCWYKFKGGKGVASTAIVALMICPVSFLILVTVFAIIVLMTKFVSLASIMSALLFPLVVNAFRGPGMHALLAIALTVIVVFMHRQNIRRLLDKTESKINLGRLESKKSPDQSLEDEDSKKDDDKSHADIDTRRNYTKNTSKKNLKRKK